MFCMVIFYGPCIIIDTCSNQNIWPRSQQLFQPIHLGYIVSSKPVVTRVRPYREMEEGGSEKHTPSFFPPVILPLTYLDQESFSP